MRAAKAADSRVQSVPEIGEVVGGSVSEGPIGPCPNILGRVELRRVSGEIVDVQPRVGREEGPDLPPPMDRAAIPEQIHGAAQMPEQMLQEGPDVETREIPGPTAEVQRQPPSFG